MEGVQYVVENGPWMINNKPMIVQEWDHKVNIEKREPSVLPVWVKLKNVPMEALTKKGICVLASNLGRPIIMNAMTTMMCNQGAESKDEDKTMQVEYQWKPVRCNHCKVYRHGLIECKKRPRTEDELKQNKGGRKEVLDRTEFEEIRNKKKGSYINNLKKKSVEVQYRPKVNVKKDILKENTSKPDMRNKNEENRNKVQKEDVNKGETEDGKKSESMKTEARKNANGKWNVNQNVMDSVKVSANKYVVLQEGYDEEFPPYISPIKQTEVDKYLKYKRKPTKEDTKEWNESEFLKENELRNEGKNVLAEGDIDGKISDVLRTGTGFQTPSIVIRVVEYWWDGIKGEL
ncbi:RNA-directed DNA polymerase, eukaryota, reverse transcriptase zinc-binding domain protein [Tanacetum coccineum]